MLVMFGIIYPFGTIRQIYCFVIGQCGWKDMEIEKVAKNLKNQKYSK